MLDRLETPPAVDLAPIEALLTALQRDVQAIPVPEPVDLQPLFDALPRLHLDALLARIDAMPTVDLQPLADRVDALPPVDLEPIEALLTALQRDVRAIPVPEPVDLEPLHERFDEIRMPALAEIDTRLVAVGERVDAASERLRAQLAELRQEIASGFASLPAPDDTAILDDLGDLRGGVGDLGAKLVEVQAAIADAVTNAPPVDTAAMREQLGDLDTRLGDVRTALMDAIRSVPVADDTAVRTDLAQLREQLGTVHTALLDAVDRVPPPDDTSVREDLVALNLQLDNLRTALADRFEAIPAPDLEPLRDDVRALASQVRSIPQPDLGPLDARLRGIQERVGSLAGPDELHRAMATSVEALQAADRTDVVLHAIDTLAGSLREELRSLPEPAPAIDAVVAPIQVELQALSTTNAALRTDLGHVASIVTGLTELSERTDERVGNLSEAQQAAVSEQRGAITRAVGELSRTLSGQVQQVESGLVQLLARTAALDDLQQGLARTREAVSGLATRADRADEARKAIADEQTLALAGVTATADSLATAIGAVRTSVEAAVEANRDATIDALDERIGAHLDETVGQVQSTMTDHVDQGLAGLGVAQLRRSLAEVTTQVVEGRTDARSISEALEGLDARITGATTHALNGLDATIARATAEAVRPLADAGDGLDARIVATTTDAGGSVADALERVRQQVDAIPAPDLGQVAAQLARLSATIVSQAHRDVVGPAHLAQLRTDLEEALAQLEERLSGTAAPDDLAELRAAIESSLDAVADRMTKDGVRRADLEELRASLEQSIGSTLEQLGAAGVTQADLMSLRRALSNELVAVSEEVDRHHAATQAVAAQLAQQPADTLELREELAQATSALQASIDRIGAEIAAARATAGDRRPTSRWRRGNDAAPEPAAAVAPAGPTELEQRVDHALRAVDERLDSLARLAERAAAFADDAAQASAATLRAVSASRTATEPAVVPPAAVPRPPAKRARATKKASTKATSAKKAAAKKAAAPVKKTAERTDR